MTPVIDHELRRTGVGASEVAAIMGLSPYQTAFDVWARKVEAMKELPSTQVQRRGRYFERAVIEWYSDFTGKQTEWWDKIEVNPDRPWQLCTPDAWVLSGAATSLATVRVRGVEGKTVNWRNIEEYGETGTADVPMHFLAQCQWSCSTTNMPYWDLAALLGMDELRVYTIERDRQAEEVMLEVVDHFWRHHVLARNPPIIGASESAANFLKQRFPKESKAIRSATPDEADMLERYRQEREAHLEREAAEKQFDALKNQVMYLIGDHEGISLPDGSWVDWKHSPRAGYTVQPTEMRVLRYHKPKRNIRRR